MLRTLVIGFGAGVASVMLAASFLSGASLAYLLFLLAPVPIAIAGLGWGPYASGTAALTGAVISAAAGTYFNVVAPLSLAGCFLALIALPVAWTAYLGGLARPGPDGQQEWFPVGRILLHAVAAVSAGTIAAGFIVGYDPAVVSEGLLAALPEGADLAGASRGQFEAVIQLLVAVMPAGFAATMLLTTVFATWLGGRVTRTSGLLPRPWTPVWTARLPAAVSAVFIAAMAATFIGGAAGEMAAVVAGTTGHALILVGLAVLHARLRGPARPALLSGLYIIIVVFGLPLLVVGLIGLADPLFRFRDRPGGRAA